MATPSWSISGQYFETCSCDFVCPCITGQMAVRPSKAILHVRHGDACGTRQLRHRPARRRRASSSSDSRRRRWARATGRSASSSTSAPPPSSAMRSPPIASGAAGGPMAPLSGLIGKFLGVEQAPIPLRSQRPRSSRSRPATSWTWRPKAPGDRSSRDRTDVHREHRPSGLEPRSRSRTHRRATSTRSAWPGTMRAGRTTATSRRSTGGVPNPVVDERPPTAPRARARA